MVRVKRKYKLPAPLGRGATPWGSLCCPGTSSFLGTANECTPKGIQGAGSYNVQAQAGGSNLSLCEERMTSGDSQSSRLG